MKEISHFLRADCAHWKKTLLVMKIAAFLLLIGIQVSARNYAQEKISLHSKNSTLIEVFKSIEKQSSFRFFFSDDVVPAGKSITLSVKNATLTEVMARLLNGLPLSWKVIDHQFVVVSPKGEEDITVNKETVSQPVTGVVKDESGQPLAGVTVTEKGTKNITVTDANGNFSINVQNSSAVLIFTYVSYQAREVPVGNRQTMNVSLVAGTNSLNDVVIVAYGTQKRSDVTGAVTTIRQSELKDIPVTQFTQKLQGKTPGVVINQTTGIPGQGMSVRIRGAVSISGSSQPLYVVDGFPIVGDIANINPDEIENISILKDASATALYGSRASNGVVIVQTKRSKSGQSNLSFNSFYGIQSVPQKGRPDMMNAEEFAQYEKEVFTDKISLGQATSIPVEYQNPSQYAGKGTDWYKLLLRNAPIQSYSVGLSGSKDRLSTSATLGYLNQEGVLLASNYKRYSLRLNADYKFNDRLTIGVNLAPSYALNATPNSDGNIFGGGIIQNAIASSPIAPAVNPDGTLPLTATSSGLFPNPNWYRVAQEVKNNTQTGRILSNAYLSLDIMNGLSFKSTVNVDYTNQQNQTWSPSTAGNLFAPPPSTATASNTSNIFYSWLTENTLNYKRSFGDHNLDVLVGYTSQKYHQNYNSESGYGFPNDRVQSLSAATQFNTPSYDIEEWSLVSLVSRLNYNYKNRYLLSASFRRDGSSRFAPNNKYGNFPAVSAGWNVGEESFMTAAPAVSNLKLRAGYGLNGNFEIGNYGYSANTQTTNYVFNNNLAPGTSISNIGNNNLGWEKSRQLDIGADIGLWKNRLFITYDYFHKITTNMLVNVGVAQESGFSSIADNVGKFDFHGHEFSITGEILTGALRWTSSFNITFVRNKVINLGPYPKNLPRSDPNGPNITQVGSPIGAFYGYKFIGVYKDQQDFDNSPKYTGTDAPSAVGTVKYADINHDGVIDVNDKTITGNPSPKYTYGMTNNLSYKKFDFSMVISGSYGNDIENRTLEYIQNLDGVFNVTKDVAHRWKSVTDPGYGVHPRDIVSTGLARTTNSRWVTRGSYLTVKNITLGYTLPFTEINYVKSIRIYTSIQQAWVFTHYAGANPEVNANGTDGLNQGIDYTSYPVPRTISFGLNLNFK